MTTTRLLKFVRRASSRGIAPIKVYSRACRIFASSHAPFRIRQMFTAMGMLIM